jgi:hypothetical protein
VIILSDHGRISLKSDYHSGKQDQRKDKIDKKPAGRDLQGYFRDRFHVNSFGTCQKMRASGFPMPSCKNGAGTEDEFLRLPFNN